MVRKQLEEAK